MEIVQRLTTYEMIDCTCGEWSSNISGYVRWTHFIDYNYPNEIIEILDSEAWIENQKKNKKISLLKEIDETILGL